MAQVSYEVEAIDPGVLELIRNERARALSLREWKFRLAGYGYAIKDVNGTQVLTSLPRGIELGVLPEFLN